MKRKRTIRIVIKRPRRPSGISAGVVRVRNAMHNAFDPLRRLVSSVHFQPAIRRIKVTESVSLGGKRFIALVRIDNQEFLVGGGSDSMVLLTPMRETQASFANTFHMTASQIAANALAREYPTQ